MSLAVLANRVSAEPWAITPRLGVSTDYSSNPELRFGNAAAEEHVAALVDLPLTYDSDGVAVALRPNGRLSNSRGYSSLASNYVHVDGTAQITDDRGSLSAQMQLAREASLYDVGAASSGVSVRRDSELFGADWSRAFTERSSLQLDASWSRLRFAQQLDSRNFVDYRYLSAGPTYSYALTELTTVNVIESVGRYQSLNGRTQSNSENLQLGLGRQLTEIWRADGSAGYSRTQDRQKVYIGPFFLGEQRSEQSGAVYSLKVSRKGETVDLALSASRSLQPVGVSFLSRRDSLGLAAAYAVTERWDCGLMAGWQRDAELVLGQAVQNRRYLSAQATVNWHWTEHWVISLHVTRAALSYGPPTISTASNGVSLDLVRQFLRADL